MKSLVIITEAAITLAIVAVFLLLGTSLGLSFLIGLCCLPFVIHNSLNNTIPYIDGVTETEPWTENI